MAEHAVIVVVDVVVVIAVVVGFVVIVIVVVVVVYLLMMIISGFCSPIYHDFQKQPTDIGMNRQTDGQTNTIYIL